MDHATMKAFFLPVLLVIATQGYTLHDEPLASEDKHGHDGSSARTVGGQQVVMGQFQVGIQLNFEVFCSGSLIHPNWVLTAAHCVNKFRIFKLFIGATDLTTYQEQSVVVIASQSIVHPDYNPSTLKNDIALLKFENVSYANFEPIQLPKRSQAEDTFEGFNAIASGWGQTSRTAVLNNKLNFAEQTVISNSKCEESYGSNIDSSVLCTVPSFKEGNCQGDTGGPLGTEVDGQRILIGLAKFLPSGDCSSGSPSGFIRVSHYLEWISQNTGITIL